MLFFRPISPAARATDSGESTSQPLAASARRIPSVTRAALSPSALYHWADMTATVTLRSAAGALAGGAVAGRADGVLLEAALAGAFGAGRRADGWTAGCGVAIVARRSDERNGVTATAS